MENNTIKVSVTLDELISLLNEALALDSQAITQLVAQRVKCNQSLAAHPTIQVGWWPIDGSQPEPGTPNIDDGKSEIRVGILGLLNGLFGAREDGWGFICARYDEVGELISSFERTPPIGHRESK